MALFLLLDYKCLVEWTSVDTTTITLLDHIGFIKDGIIDMSADKFKLYVTLEFIVQ